MISKIIQKEKERQKVIINHDSDINRFLQRRTHKQSLINLKEYMEEDLIDLQDMLIPIIMNPSKAQRKRRTEFLNKRNDRSYKFHEDIKELNKMIEKYG